MRLGEFLKECRTRFNELNAKNTDILIVCGNQSCDLDSIVSAISYSYYKFIKSNYSFSYFPILNTTKDVLRLKDECNYLFECHSIDSNDLILIEDLKSTRFTDYKVALVDHNTLDEKQMLLEFSSKITEIIDHHKDERQFLYANPRLIDNDCISNSLLISEFFYKDDIMIENDLASFLLFPILTDSSNMNPKRERKREIDDLLFKYLLDKTSNEFKINYKQVYDKIIELKTNLNNKSLIDIFENDYKQWLIDNNNEKKLKYGISSIKSSFKIIQDKESQGNLNESIKKFMEIKQINAQFLLLSSDHQRELVMFSTRNHIDNFVQFDKQFGELSLIERDAIDDNLSQVWFKCNDPKKTRKFWQPIIDKFFRQ